MGVAADCTYVSTYGGQENATQQILNNWNYASSLFKVRGRLLESCIYINIPFRVPSTSVSGSLNSKFAVQCEPPISFRFRTRSQYQTRCSCPTAPDPNFPWNTPCSSAELDARLSQFSQWRGQKGDDGNGLWHLMSGCPTGSEVGIAWLATLYVFKFHISRFDLVADAILLI